MGRHKIVTRLDAYANNYVSDLFVMRVYMFCLSGIIYLYHVYALNNHDIVIIDPI